MPEILTRSTKDVDALAFVVDSEVLKPIEGFSPEMDKAIAQTARRGMTGWNSNAASKKRRAFLGEGLGFPELAAGIR